MPPVEESTSVLAIQCYNKGCGKKFNPEENTPDSCAYHPGPPYFHDAYKIWNCCQKKSTDFGTWLTYPGCTKGKHNGVKPDDIVKVAAVKEIRPEKEDEVIVWKGLNKPAERKTEQERVEISIKVEATTAARNGVEKYRQTIETHSVDSIRIGAPCRNSGCDKKYSGPESDSSRCCFHPGKAIFHEGMKYWSCCQKKTSNFNAFLEQKGCENGKHQWSNNELVKQVREDWFSSNGNITVNVYCKGALPDDVNVSSDGQQLRVHILHGYGNKETDLIYELWGEIVPEDSKVIVGERKVEIVLKQRDLVGWPRLRYESDLDKAEPAESSLA